MIAPERAARRRPTGSTIDAHPGLQVDVDRRDAPPRDRPRPSGRRARAPSCGGARARPRPGRSASPSRAARGPEAPVAARRPQALAAGGEQPTDLVHERRGRRIRVLAARPRRSARNPSRAASTRSRRSASEAAISACDAVVMRAVSQSGRPGSRARRISWARLPCTRASRSSPSPPPSSRSCCSRSAVSCGEPARGSAARPGPQLPSGAALPERHGALADRVLAPGVRVPGDRA